MLVALIKAEKLSANITPNKTLVAGYFSTSNSGGKTVINNGATGEVWVRCGSQPFTPPVTGCASYEDDKKVSQVSPERVYSDANYPPAMSPDELERVRNLAIAQGNYYGERLPGEPCWRRAGRARVHRERDGLQVQRQRRSTTHRRCQGALVIANGTLEISGNSEFHGLCTTPMSMNKTGTSLPVQGTGCVQGGVIVDGPGGVQTGSSKETSCTTATPATR